MIDKTARVDSECFVSSKLVIPADSDRMPDFDFDTNEFPQEALEPSIARLQKLAKDVGDRVLEVTTYDFSAH